MTQQQKRTLFFLYLRQISAGLLIYQPVFLPFLKSKGINEYQFSVLFTSYNLGILLLAVPLGHFADRVGKKWALLTANLAYVFGTLMIAGGDSFLIFMLAEVIYSIAVALDMSSHAAFLYAFLREQGKESEYYRYEAFGMFMFLVFGAVGTLIGGFMAQYDLAMPIYWTAALTAIGVPCAFMLKEPIIPESTSSSNSNGKPRSSAEEILGVAKSIISSPGIMWAIGLAVIWLWTRQYINFVVTGAYFSARGVSFDVYGKVAALLSFSAGLLAFYSRKLIQRPDLRLLTLVGTFFIPLSYFIMSTFNQSFLGYVGYVFFAVPLGLCTAVTNTLLNRQFSDHAHRTTFLSMVDVAVRLTASALTMLLGRISKETGFNSALTTAATITIALAVFITPGIFKYARDPAEKNSDNEQAS